MTQANELRIGNWVNETVLGNRQVHGIADICIDLQGDEGLYSIDPENIRPIPLTPEVLEACGFDWDNDTNEYANYRIKANIRLHAADDYNVIWITGDAFECDLCTIKHLHELQNLIFSLTGKELNYKPK